MTYYRTTAWLVLSLLAASACTDTEPRTQVMLEIDADQAVRAELGTLRVLISVSDDAGKTWNPRLTETFDDKRVGGWAGFEWPARLGLVPDGDNFDRRFSVRVQALDGGGDLYVWQSAVAGFTKGHTTVLPMSLSAACAAMLSSCGDPSCVGTKGCDTCNAGQCDEVELATLKDFDPKAKPRDAGSDGEGEGDAGDAATHGDADSGGMDDDDHGEAGINLPRDAGPDSGEDTGPGEQPKPPKYHVVSSTPDADDPELAEDDDVVQVKFSAPVDAESISWESFIVTRNGEELDGEFSVGKTTVTFDPDEPWVLGGRYHLELTDAIEDADGNPLDPFELDFRFHDGTWMFDQRATNLVVTARIAAAPNGDAVLAVLRMGSSTFDISARRFLAPTTWESELPVISDSALTAIAISNKHHPFIAGNTLSNNYAGNTYLEGPSWQGAGSITAGGSDPGSVLDPDTDELHMVASVPGGSGNVLRGLDYTLGEIGTAEVTIGDDVADNRSPRVTLLDGEPIVAWRRDDGSSPAHVVAGTFNVMLPQTLSDVSADALTLQLVSNQAESSAIAIWEEVDMTWNNVWVSRIAAGGDWSDAKRLSDNLSSAQGPQLAMDDQGRALAVWKQDDVVMAAAYDPADDWSEPIQASDEAGNITLPLVALEPGGNGFAAWVQDNPVDLLNEVWVARYLAGKGWQSPERVSPVDAATTEDISLAIDNRGRAFVTWIAANNAWVARFE